MLSLNDIINVSFRKSGFSGYRTEDVDNFIDRVRESYDALLKKGVEQDEQIEKLKTDNQQMDDKIKILAEKIEEYRSQEDEIKKALISAQKLGDASVREARHKAEIIVKDANLKADRIIAGANEKITQQKTELEKLQRAASDFRSKLLNLYKEHLTMINALPTYKPETKPETGANVPAAPRNDAPLQPAAPQQPEEAASSGVYAEEAAEDGFHADISNFDDDLSQE